ncbi:MAG TPA: STAS domain-containing protein [Bacteroidota bacterium]|nr:STAS domain-containing protein [Bacteroidota bacterium]
MHVDEKMVGDVAVVSLAGEMLFDDDDFVLQQKIASLRLDGIQKIIIDLKRLNRINSRGLSALLRAVRQMRENGGDIRLAQIDRRLTDLLAQTKLVQVFNTYETVGRAMASYL